MKLLRSFIDAVSSPIVVVCLIFLGHHQSLVSRVDAFGVVPNSIRSVPSKDQHALNIVPVPVTDPNRNSIRTTRADRSSLSLQIGGDGEGGGEDSASLSPSINIQLVLQNVASQALLGYTIWNGGVGRTVLTEEAHFGLGAIVYGIAGVIPMLALSRAIETSESRYVSTLNLSTNMAVLRLFGPTPQPILALLISLFLASSTGLVEETIFRGQCKLFKNTKLRVIGVQTEQSSLSVYSNEHNITKPFPIESSLRIQLFQHLQLQMAMMF